MNRAGPGVARQDYHGESRVEKPRGDDSVADRSTHEDITPAVTDPVFDAHRLRDSVASTTHYEETQYFRQPWLWALLVISGVPAALLGIVAVTTDAEAGTNAPLWIGVVLVVVFGPFVILYRATLRIEARDDALLLCLWPFHLRARRIPYAEIESITATEISPMADLGGLGVRIQPTFYRWGIRFDGPVGYIVEGTRAVRITRAGASTLVVTSTDPDTLVRTVERIGRAGR